MKKGARTAYTQLNTYYTMKNQKQTLKQIIHDKCMEILPTANRVYWQGKYNKLNKENLPPAQYLKNQQERLERKVRRLK